jgi:hypothetical protein
MMASKSIVLPYHSFTGSEVKNPNLFQQHGRQAMRQAGGALSFIHRDWNEMERLRIFKYTAGTGAIAGAVVTDYFLGNMVAGYVYNANINVALKVVGIPTVYTVAALWGGLRGGAYSGVGVGGIGSVVSAIFLTLYGAGGAIVRAGGDVYSAATRPPRNNSTSAPKGIAPRG